MKRGEISGAAAEAGCDEGIVLSERDSMRVLELLRHPPEPPAALLAAARRRARAAMPDSDEA
jgi:uncharacterized protein (DUF1778 family)